MTASDQAPAFDPAVAPRRRWWPWVVAAAVIVAAVGTWLVLAGDGNDDDSQAAAPVRFADVVRTDLEEVTTLDGTLGRGDGDTIPAARAGIVTAAPEPGDTVQAGEVLYEIDASPVVLLIGSTPAYRAIAVSEETRPIVARSGGTVTAVGDSGAPVVQGDVLFEIDGEPVVVLYGEVPAYRPLLDLSDNMIGADVAQLETALDALGFNDASATIDDEFTGATEAMVENWQEAIGAEVDGVVDLGHVVFIPGPSEVVAVDVDVGDVLTPGRVVVALAGTEPMTGTDVEQLEASLAALGYDPGPVDGTFTAETKSAVRNWQEARGLEVDGVVDVGEVVFWEGPVRVASQVTAPGAAVAAGGPVLTVTSNEIVVTAELPAEDQDILAEGDTVVVQMPDETELPATVSEVATVATRNAAGATIFEVTITLDDPAAAGDLDEAPVEVSVVTDSVSDVIAVPVTALLALLEGGYAVEAENADGTTTLVEVEPGFYADGLVELLDAPVQPGDRVVVP